MRPTSPVSQSGRERGSEGQSFSRCPSTGAVSTAGRCSKGGTTSGTTRRRGRQCGGRPRTSTSMRGRRKGRVPGWARRIAFPLKGRSSAGYPGQSRDRAWEGKREDGEEDTRAACRRPHESVGAKGGGRHQEPDPFFKILHDAADGEGTLLTHRGENSFWLKNKLILVF